MIKIAHRGNINGPNPAKENNPEYLQIALDAGYDCEIDVWDIDNNIFLGHDNPTHLVTKQFIDNEKFWCHAKNLDALHYMLFYGIHCFWHEEDERTLTSKGKIWTYPDRAVTNKSIICLQGPDDKAPADCLGICTDYVINYK